jgi:hypothetical protein
MAFLGMPAIKLSSKGVELSHGIDVRFLQGILATNCYHVNVRWNTKNTQQEYMIYQCILCGGA